MFGVQKYAYVNARLRARLQYLLDETVYQKMLNAVTLDEAVLHLNNTSYESFYTTYKKTGDLMAAEQSLSQAQLALFANIGLGLPTPIQNFVRSLLTLHELRFLKTALHVWYYRVVGRQNAMRLTMHSGEMKIAYNINYDDLMAASSLAEITDYLAHTPYAKVITEHMDRVMKEKSLYSLEVALDRQVYDRINQAIRLLPAVDGIGARKLIGSYIDLENLQFGIGLTYYRIKMSEIEPFFLNGGLRLNKAKWIELLSNEQQLRETLVAWYPDLEKQKDRKMSQLLQQAQSLQLLSSARTALTANPFSSAPIIAYFFLVEYDIKRLVSLLNSKFYGVSPENISESMPNLA